MTLFSRSCRATVKEVAVPETILIRVTGNDRPGITTELLSLLAGLDAELQDIEQVVVRRQLTLGLAVVVPAGRDLVKEVLLFGWERSLEIDFEVVDAAPTRHARRQVVTILAPELSPTSLARASGAIAACGGNIHRIHRLSRFPVGVTSCWSKEPISTNFRRR